MATTGDLPPMVDKGAAFIHDPRIHNETETKAKIRLLFTNVRGDQYVVSRHFQLSLKRGPHGIGYKTEFKTLDQTVKRMDGGAASSYRCADLNALLPDIMRVTKPVLNNVIFVHQEDSLWPLGDSKKLKEKFDEIFAATRYTKALDTIRKFRKDQAADLKTINVELLHYEDKVQLLEKVRGELDVIRVRHDELRQGVDTLDSEITSLLSEKGAAENVAKDYLENQSKLMELQVEGQHVEKSKMEKYSNMKMPLPDMNDEALSSEISDLKSLLEGADDERAERRKVIQNLRADLETKRSEVNSRQSRKGRLEQLAREQSNRLSRLEALKEECLTADYFKIAGDSKEQHVSFPHMTASLQEWTEAIHARQRKAEEHVKLTSERCNKNLDAATENVNKARWRVQETKSTCKRKTEDISERRAKLVDVRHRLRDLNDTHESIREAEIKLHAAEVKLSEKRNNSAAPQLEELIRSEKKEIASFREDLESLRETRQKLEEYQSDHEKFKVMRNMEKKKKNQVERLVEEVMEVTASAVTELGIDREQTSLLLNEINHGITTITLASMDRVRNTILESSDKVLARKDATIRQAERHRSGTLADLKSAAFRKAETEDYLAEVSEQVMAFGNQIAEGSARIATLAKTSVDVEPVLQLFRDCRISSGQAPFNLRREELGVVQKAVEAGEKAAVRMNQKISQLESGALLAEDDLETFEQDPKHRCPACGLASSKKVEDMRRNLTNRIQYLKDPKSSKAAAQELVELELLLRAMKKVQSTATTAAAELVKFHSAKSKFTETQRAHQDCEKYAKAAEAALDTLQRRFGAGSAMDQIGSKQIEMRQACADWDRAAREVTSLQAVLPGNSGGDRSLADIDDKIRECEDRIRSGQDEIEKNTRSLERDKDHLRTLENRFRDAEKHCLSLQNAAENHKRWKRESDELSMFVRDTELEVERLRESLKSQELALEYSTEKQLTVRAENDMILRESNVVASKRRRALQRWDDCVTEVEAFARSTRGEELESIVASLKSIQSDIECLEKYLQEHENEQETASASLADMESRIRNLRDNQSFRIYERKLQVIQRSAKHVQDAISSLERSSGGDPSEKVDGLTARINSKNETRAATIGKRQVFRDRYKEKKEELNKAEEQGSRKKYDECRIRKQTMELASSDLEKYHRALDQALMAFHTLKMNSINRTIKELWQQTYRGTDIDEIEVISDHGDPRANVAGALKRTFNYRVQMRQGQATLDMRGRCSAGQKVLACLVIRLALAESFCTDCGILALDEPTTNLDRENIESLAEALRAIIESRRRQRNFQLVLITHDQEFIDLIGARDFCNEYFMVYKDMQGISQARVQDLQEV